MTGKETIRMQSRFAQAQLGRVTVETEEIGNPAGGQLLLKARYSALSPGTERDLIEGHILPLPQHVGYSMIAKVVAAGEDVRDFREGDIVAVTGQHEEYFLVDEHTATPVPDGVDEEQAALFVLAHTALYALRRTNLQLGESIAVLGQGMVGQLTALLARVAGACPVIVSDIDDKRLALSRQLGAHIAVNVRDNPGELERVVQQLGGASVGIEAAGSVQTMNQAFGLAGERGRVMILSTVHPDTGSRLDTDSIMRTLFMKGAQLIGSYVNSKPFSLKRYDLEFPEHWPPKVSKEAARFRSSDIWTSDEDIRCILNLIKYGALDLRPLITHRFSVEQIPEAYQLVWDKDPGLLGGIICWEE